MDKVPVSCQREAASAAIGVSDALHRHYLSGDALNLVDVNAFAQRLADIDRMPAKRVRTSPNTSSLAIELPRGDLDAVQTSLASVIQTLIQSSSLTARIGGCATTIVCARLHPSLASKISVHLVPDLVRHMGAHRCELLPIIVFAAIAAIVAIGSLPKREFVKAGLLPGLVDGIRRALLGAATEGGNASPLATLLPVFASAVLCELGLDHTCRKMALEAGALAQCLALVVVQIDPQSASCRIAQHYALRYVALMIVCDKSDAVIEESATPSLVSLVHAPEVSVRKGVIQSAQYIMQAGGEDRFAPASSPGFLHGVVSMFPHFATKGDALRLIFIMARIVAVRREIKRMGFAAPLEAVVLDPRNASMHRVLALRTLFALGEFDIFLRSRAWEACKEEELAGEVKRLESLVEDRKMQLAFESRPAIEAKYTKAQLLEFMQLFNEEAEERRGKRAITQEKMLRLLTKCCVATNDKTTRKKLTRGLVRKICEAYDADKSGRIEWDEFLQVMLDLMEGALVGALLAL